MASSILSTLSSLMSNDLIDKASTAVGEPASGVGTALRMAGPALLAGMMKKGSSPGGLADLLAGITSPSIDENVAAKATKLLGNGAGFNQLTSKGTSLISSIFGDRADGVAGALSQVAGLKQSSALKLFALAAPMLGGVMKRFIGKGGMNPAGLASALANERESLLAADLDPRLTSAMGITNLRQTVDSFSSAAADQTATATSAGIGATDTTYSRARPTRRQSNWWPWAIGAAAVALGLAVITNLVNRGSEAGRAGAAQVSVYFDRDQATIDSDDRRAIAAAAASARASGSELTVTPVAASGEADDQQLAAQRAAAIRDELISEGIANDQIVLRTTQVARSEEPAAEAQRVEIALAGTPENRRN
jgi:outer membrane protein OmpA-like peptidoglycan-associated protein